MALQFTYSHDPSKSHHDAVRFNAGDTDEATAQFSDGEIDYAATEYPDARIAAAYLLDALSAKYARQASFSVGQISKQMGDRAKALGDAANKLRNEAGKKAQPFFGGLSRSGKETLDSNSDAIKPKFRVGQFDSPRVTQFDENVDNDPIV